MKLKQKYFVVSAGMATAIALAASGCLKKSESTLTSDAGIQISPDKLSYGFTEDFLMRVFSQNNMDRNAVAGELVAIVRADWRETLPLKSRSGDFKKFGELKKDDDITAVGSVAISKLAEFGKHFQVRSLNQSDASAYEFVRLRVSDATPEGLRKAINELHTLNAIQFAEPNYEAKLIARPNEPLFASLWGLTAINAPAAWDLTTGSDRVTVAVIDSGVDYTHPDLVANIWSNPKEVENQIDDDGNGFVDDIRGWNFWDGNNDPMDRYGHGTHVAGIIGARGNNAKDVAGVSWSTKLMPIKVFSDAGQSTTANIINGILYAANSGAQILNNSYSSGISVALTNAVIHSRDKNTLFVAAAGNDGAAGAVYPASLSTSVENVISVASTDANNALSTFSNHGVGVNIAAPGGQILSTFPSNRLVYLSGTSMAAPHVAGVAALMLSHSPNTRALEIKDAILATGQQVPALANRVQSGLLNARAAVDQVTSVPGGTVYQTIAEYGQVSVDHNWATVQLQNTYTAPVVITSDPTLRGGDPAVVRLNNIDADSFELRIQEPNYKDGVHVKETISYIVIEAGTWTLPDGTIIAAGTKNTNKLSTQGREVIALPGAFDPAHAPAVLTQIQTANGGDWVTTRTDKITGQAFEVMMQEEEKLNSGAHVTENIGWLAVESGTADDGDTLIEGGTTPPAFDHTGGSASFQQTFSEAPTLLTKLSSFHGADTANSRVSAVSSTGFAALVQEEQSLDSEIAHKRESLSFLALEGFSGILQAIAPPTQ